MDNHTSILGSPDLTDYEELMNATYKQLQENAENNDVLLSNVAACVNYLENFVFHANLSLPLEDKYETILQAHKQNNPGTIFGWEQFLNPGSYWYWLYAKNAAEGDMWLSEEPQTFEIRQWPRDINPGAAHPIDLPTCAKSSEMLLSCDNEGVSLPMSVDSNIYDDEAFGLIPGLPLFQVLDPDDKPTAEAPCEKAVAKKPRKQRAQNKKASQKRGEDSRLGARGRKRQKVEMKVQGHQAAISGPGTSGAPIVQRVAVQRPALPEDTAIPGVYIAATANRLPAFDQRNTPNQQASVYSGTPTVPGPLSLSPAEPQPSDRHPSLTKHLLNLMGRANPPQGVVTTCQKGHSSQPTRAEKSSSSLLAMAPNPTVGPRICKRIGPRGMRLDDIASRPFNRSPLIGQGTPSYASYSSTTPYRPPIAIPEQERGSGLPIVGLFKTRTSGLRGNSYKIVRGG
ncbi:hypothetical protein B0I35DRAFT_509910 [Stachybotrys elegans]|uniref:Uncharacterized protein n=1 Tax=Stachybotrys elegans TaxID=80388 RepID=A0A8K0SZL9_9HYPO|nr:hypothetical protein B0I35DRAFT_509910 [Stachybotrys elegans]